MKPTLEQTARDVAEDHRQIEPGLRRVVYYPDPSGAEVRLVEVVDGSPYVGEALPVRFAPAPAENIYYPVAIAELSPDEYARVERGEIALPDGWEDGETIFAA